LFMCPSSITVDAVAKTGFRSLEKGLLVIIPSVFILFRTFIIENTIVVSFELTLSELPQ
jgi:hypothetical protein